MKEPKLPEVCGKYGAPMGRRGNPANGEPVGRLRLYRVRLDSGGYDNGGAYWGIGPPLYRVVGETADEEIDRFFRASSREEAKAIVREEWYPDATFYR